MLGFSLSPRLDHPIDVWFMIGAPFGVGPLGMSDKVFASDRLQQSFPHTVSHRLAIDIDVIVRPAWLAFEDARRRHSPELIPRAQDDISFDVVFAHLHATKTDHRILHRHFELLPLAGRLALP